MVEADHVRGGRRRSVCENCEVFMEIVKCVCENYEVFMEIVKCVMKFMMWVCEVVEAEYHSTKERINVFVFSY